jgi:hypothetical protein
MVDLAGNDIVHAIHRTLPGFVHLSALVVVDIG